MRNVPWPFSRAGRLHLLLLLCTLCTIGLLGFPSCQPPRVLVLFSPESVATWERFESAGFVWHGMDNPFDPDQVDLRGEFIDPDGAVLTMPGFATRDFERRLVGGFEKLDRVTPLYWKVRFTPKRPGVWRWRWQLTTPKGEATSPWRMFTATDPAPDRHGALRVSPEDPRYLRFEDGAPFFAVGENMAWYDGRGSFAYDDWFERLADEGANYVRLWMPSWAFSIEWLRREDGEIVGNSLGRYEDRLDRAWQLDSVLEAAERHGIYVMLCIQNHGPFSLDANSQWADNPYNAANGGPLAEPEAFFSDEAARRLFRQRLRYVVARWGYSPNILAWELWNELNLVVRTNRADVLAWHSEMGGVLRDLDPYDHLVTTSVSLGDEATPLWDLPEIDFTQSHTYNWPFLFDHGELLALFSDRTRVPGKPTLIAEHGVDFRGPAETLVIDPASIAFHDGLWIGVMAETFGTGMSWWWDNVIDPEDLYFHFGAVARFVDGVAFHTQDFLAASPALDVEGRNLRGYALLGNTINLLWIKNLDHQFVPEGSAGDPVAVENATLTLADVGNGAWQALWIDTRTAGEVAREDVEVADGTLTLPVPAFIGDIALRMERIVP